MAIRFRIFVTILMIQVSTQYTLHPRIVNGDDASPYDYPFIAFIETSIPPLTIYSHECAGVVFDDYHIVSTSLCIGKIKAAINYARVKIGMYYTKEADGSVQTIDIADAFIHEDYSSTDWTNDIGLIILKTAINNPAMVKFVPRGPDRKVVIAGWGYTSSNLLLRKKPKVLQYAIQYIQSSPECEAILLDIYKVNRHLDKMLCTYSPTILDHIAAYIGDVGGPIMQHIDGELRVIGLIARTVYPQQKDEAPTIGTQIAPFLPWIEHNIEKQPNMDGNNNLGIPLLGRSN